MASGEPPPALAGPPAAAARPSRALQAVAVCAAVFLLAAFSISRRCQLGYMGGLVDEHFVLGVKLRVNGTLGPAAGEPSTLRPPGYPAFVAAVVALLAPSPERAAAAEFRDAAQRAVYLAQAVTLGVAAALVFLWLAFGSLSYFTGQFIGKTEMIAIGTLLTLARRRALPTQALEPA